MLGSIRRSLRYQISESKRNWSTESHYYLNIYIYIYLFVKFGFKKKGDDGRDFITVALCGDDFIAALADFEEGTEEWDDVQALETEAQGTLAEMFCKAKTSDDNGFETDDDGESRSAAQVHVIEDSPPPDSKNNNPDVMELDSSSDFEDDDDDGTQFKAPMTGSRNHFSRSMVNI